MDRKVIVIDGLIGAGKTTLINMLADSYMSKGYNVCVMLEPVKLWQEIGALDHFYKDITNHGYEFQTFVYVSRIKDVIEKFEANPNADIYLLERSIFTDRYIFVEMLKERMGKVRFDMYVYWWDMWFRLMPFIITNWVFLDTSVDIAQERICIRDRKEEAGINIGYQMQLLEYHHKFYDKLKADRKKINVIGSELMNANIYDNPDILDKIMQQLDS